MSKPSLSYAEMMEAADALLHEEWRELRNGAGAGELLHFSGMVRALHAAAILSDDQRELWGRRHTTCPGHDDEGGRDWCAFCGDMPREPARDAEGFPVLTITAPDCDPTCVSCQAGDHDECGVGCHEDGPIAIAQQAQHEDDEEPPDGPDQSDVPMAHEMAADERWPYLDGSDFWREAPL
jgi:hypothetical protein